MRINSYTLLGVLIINILNLLSFSLKAQTTVFAQLTGSPVNTTGWTLTGRAAVGNVTGTGNSEIILVPVTTQATGAIYYSTPINAVLCNKWAAEFDFRINDGNSADGLAFWYLDVPPTGFVPGIGLGIPANANGLKVCFDTYNNFANPPTTDMPKIQIRWGIGYSELSTQPTAVNAFGLLSFIRSPTYNRARVTYDNGNIKVYVNNTLYLSGFQVLTFPGYFGFSASVGALYDNHSIKNAVIYIDRPPAAAGPDKVICNNTTTQIGDTTIPNYVYNWSPASGLSSTSASNPQVTIVNNSTQPLIQQYIVNTGLTGSPACSSSDTVRVTVLPTPRETLTQTICEGDSFLGYYNTGMYTDTLTNALGCDSIRTLNLSVTPRSRSNLTQTICEGDSYLGYSVSGIYSDTLAAASGCDSVRTLTLTVTPRTYSTINTSVCEGEAFAGYTAGGTYIDTLVSTAGCDSIRTINLQIIPRVFTSVDTFVCAGQSFAGYSASGTYIDTLTGVNTCDSVRTLRLTVIPNPDPTFTASPSSGCPPLDVLFTNTSSQLSGVIYQWNFGDMGSSNSQLTASHTYPATGSYTVTLTGTNNNGCVGDATQSSVITVYPLPLAGFNTSPNPNTFGNPIISFTDASTGAASWQWTFGDGIGSSSQQNPVYSYANANTYEVMLVVSTENNCKDTAYDEVIIYPLDDIYIPNAFTPNGDGLNENFGVFGLGFRNVEMAVYNRYGNRIYFTNANQPRWDGTIRGKKCDMGTYAYVIRLTDSRGERRIYKGNVLLIR